MREEVQALVRSSQESAAREKARREAIAQGLPVEPNLLDRIAALEAKTEEVAKITRKLYKIFLWTGIVTVAAIVLPIVFAVLALPSLLGGLDSITGASNAYGDLLR